jgi:hypothetical protein
LATCITARERPKSLGNVDIIARFDHPNHRRAVIQRFHREHGALVANPPLFVPQPDAILAGSVDGECNVERIVIAPGEHGDRAAIPLRLRRRRVALDLQAHVDPASHERGHVSNRRGFGKIVEAGVVGHVDRHFVRRHAGRGEHVETEDVALVIADPNAVLGVAAQLGELGGVANLGNVSFHEHVGIAHATLPWDFVSRHLLHREALPRSALFAVCEPGRVTRPRDVGEYLHAVAGLDFLVAGGDRNADLGRVGKAHRVNERERGYPQRRRGQYREQSRAERGGTEPGKRGTDARAVVERGWSDRENGIEVLGNRVVDERTGQLVGLLITAVAEIQPVDRDVIIAEFTAIHVRGKCAERRKANEGHDEVADREHHCRNAEEREQAQPKDAARSDQRLQPEGKDPPGKKEGHGAQCAAPQEACAHPGANT